MNVLLDTHAFLWWCTDDRRLGKAARVAVAQADTVAVSAASAWEAAIKVALKRLVLPELFSKMVLAQGFTELPVTFRHAERLALLPAHRSDPFDRLLAAQALAEALTVVTHDQVFEHYRVPVVRT